MSVFTGGPYGRLAVMLNTLSSLNIEIIIIIIIIIICKLAMRQCVNDVRKGRQLLRRPMYRPAIPTAPKCGRISVLERR